MKCLLMILLSLSAVGLSACVNVKTWSGDVYDCPREVLEKATATIDAWNILQQQNAQLMQQQLEQQRKEAEKK